MAAGILAVDSPIDDEQSDVRGDVDVPRVNVDGQAKVKEALVGGGSRGTGDRLSRYGDEDAGTFIELFESGRLSAVEARAKPVGFAEIPYAPAGFSAFTSGARLASGYGNCPAPMTPS